MARKEPTEAKGRPTPKAPQNDTADIPADDLDVEEVLAGYEAQIGQLTGQLIRQNVLIRSLRKELVKKNGAAPTEG